MEEVSPREARKVVRLLEGLRRNDLEYEDVSGRQIISALLEEIGVKFAEGYLYQVIKNVASEARRRHLLINPNPYTRETYSAAVGNTNRMLPSLTGWNQTKGILARHLYDARQDLLRVLAR